RGGRALQHHRGAGRRRQRRRCRRRLHHPGTVFEEPAVSTPPALDAEALYDTLREQLRLLQGTPHLHLVGVTSGGAWLAERLQQDLALTGAMGVLSSSMHCDDFGRRGLVSSSAQTTLPFEVNDAHIVILDDV